MLVLLDMDGVLTDFEEGFVREWKKRFPNIPYIPKNKRNDFYVQKQYPENLQKNVDIIMRSRGFSFNLPPMYGAKKAVREMLKAGIKLRICTSPLGISRFSLQDKYDWTVKHLGREMAKNTFEKSFLVFNKSVKDDDEFNTLFKNTLAVLSKKIAKRIVLASGSLDDITKTIAKEIAT